jgi:lipopolysaccharide export system protein LptA
VRWQWPARIIVAAIGLGVAVAIVVSANRRSRPAEPATSLQVINPNVVAKGGAGRTQFLRAGKDPVNLTSKGSEEDRSGHRFFTDVLVEGLESDRFTIKGDRLDLDGPDDNPTTFNVSGHVVITTSDGLHLETDKAIYDNTTGRLNMPGSVTYTKGRISGSALAAGYDRDRDVITLLGSAKARVEPDATGKGAADATATRMSLARGQHMLDMDESARIVGDSQVLTGDKAIMTFTEDDRAIKVLELHGAARAMPKAGARDAADQPDMAADHITMAFQADGVTLQRASLLGQASLALAGASARSIHAAAIDLAMGPDGHTLTNLKANDRVVVDLAATATSRARTITAGSLVATGDDAHGLTSARFEGAPVFTERAEPSPAGGAAPAAPLRGKGTVLVLTLGGQLDAIETAEFQQQAEFKSGEATAQGDIARYDQAHDVVHFLPNEREPRKKPHVENADIKVDAWSIDLHTASQDLIATDGVTTQSRSKPGSAGSPGAALFDATKTVSGSSDRLEYTKSTGVATYRGGKVQAKLWQGSSKIQADRIAYADISRNLQAWGSVDSTWLFEAGPSGKPATSGAAKPGDEVYRVQAETLDYDDAARLATFKAPEVTLNTADGEIRSSVLTLRLAAASRALDELRAEGRVWSKMSGDYESVSDTLVFQVEKDLYVLRGKENSLARVKSPKDDAPKPDPARPDPAAMCTVTTGLHIVVHHKEKYVDQPGVSQARRTTTEQPCSTPLRRPEK